MYRIRLYHSSTYTFNDTSHIGALMKVSVSSCACDGKAAALIVCAMDPSSETYAIV